MVLLARLGQKVGGRGKVQEDTYERLPILHFLMLQLEIGLQHESCVEDIQLGLQVSHQEVVGFPHESCVRALL